MVATISSMSTETYDIIIDWIWDGTPTTHFEAFRGLPQSLKESTKIIVLSRPPHRFGNSPTVACSLLTGHPFKTSSDFESENRKLVDK